MRNVLLTFLFSTTAISAQETDVSSMCFYSLSEERPSSAFRFDFNYASKHGTVHLKGEQQKRIIKEFSSQHIEPEEPGQRGSTTTVYGEFTNGYFTGVYVFWRLSGPGMSTDVTYIQPNWKTQEFTDFEKTQDVIPCDWE